MLSELSLRPSFTRQDRQVGHLILIHVQNILVTPCKNITCDSSAGPPESPMMANNCQKICLNRRFAGRTVPARE